MKRGVSTFLPCSRETGNVCMLGSDEDMRETRIGSP